MNQLPFKLRLRDLNAALVTAWKDAFADLPAVDIQHGNILDGTADAIVSPANSFGFMDGGIDLAYSHFFGWELEARLKEVLSRDHGGELPVGQAVIVPTGHQGIPYLVSAPTMRVPGSIAETVNVYLACRAALMAVVRFEDPATGRTIRSLLVPGLGTGVGSVTPERATRQMRAAHDTVARPPDARRSAQSVLQAHRALLL